MKKENEVIDVSHKKMAMMSLVILVPAQIVMVGLSPVVLIWVCGRWVVEGRWKLRVLGARLVIRWGWPWLVFWDWVKRDERLKKWAERGV